jgi:ubiquinol oxidase
VDFSVQKISFLFSHSSAHDDWPYKKRSQFRRTPALKTFDIDKLQTIMIMQTFALFALVAGASAFQISPHVSRVPAASSPRSIMRTVVAAATKTEVAVKAPSKTPEMMDAGVFNFNKNVIDTVYALICFLYPVKGTERDFARFYVLETVARVPYFAYLSVMHLRETFGDRTDGLGERMRTHYAEADNELHHLLIMEGLGGNSKFVDRTLAQTMAFGYYWYVIAIFFFSPPAAYHLSELIEGHAFNTYDKYLTEHADMLKKLPVPDIAKKYYMEDNPFLFDLFCTVKEPDDNGNFSARRPTLESLYDVFVNVRDDEKEHWKTLCNLVQFNDMQGAENSMVQSTKPKPV